MISYTLTYNQTFNCNTPIVKENNIHTLFRTRERDIVKNSSFLEIKVILKMRQKCFF